ncbi:MAG TPA: M20/M25/M40 family metallo-hydrolase [Bdellovibrionales bacterium]|nr:M20/M25/M40 family metallo-hydrolase [Bdellovibrionales bacterium]
MKKLAVLTLLTAILVFSGNPCHAQPNDYDQLAKATRALLEKFVEADPTNPPGNEARIAKLAAERFKAAGIPFELTEFAPGRQNIVARLKGAGTEKPVLILAHTDVVGAANQAWTVPSNKVTEKDGYLYGRGVLDDLGMAALAVEMLVHLKTTNQPLRRDVIVALTGDEESGGAGLEYILKNKPGSVDAAFALNEGGGLALGDDGKVKFISLQVAEKTYQDFELYAKGPTGHSSVPLKDNVIARMGRALAKLGAYERPARLIPATRAYYLGRAKVEKPPLSTAMHKLATTKGAKLPADALKVLEADPIQAANLRTTCVATLVSGGTRVNALPAEAKATVNCRILPDETKEQIKADLAKVIGDPAIEIKMPEEVPGGPASDLQNEAPVAIEKTAQKFWPGLPLIPTMSRGATDSRFLRARGIPAYGIIPMPVNEQDARRAHGIDERIPAASIRTGVEYLHHLLQELAGAKNK